MNKTIDELLTVKQVGATLQLSERTVRQLVSSGSIPSHKIGGSIRVTRADLANYVASCRQSHRSSATRQTVRLRRLTLPADA